MQALRGGGIFAAAGLQAPPLIMNATKMSPPRGFTAYASG
ncbi:Uncharacterized protein dnm_005520 [Desulfonema magnum]|uniref:Uncharacterized protein n=1 Tax=Desulfonema magnum TaxID=45655 RepID=A0A975GKI5_9BACT|nr:Uncharacterized protein dnm_005520 [Desulfonema magnum]